LRHLKADADLEEYTLYLTQRRQIYRMIRGGAYGILLASDAHAHELNVLDLLPADAHAPILYQAVVLAGENMDQARRFLEYLKSREAAIIFANYGLTAP